MPVLVLGPLNILAFLMPQEERAAYTVTVLLAMTVFLTVIGDNIPKTCTPTTIMLFYRNTSAIERINQCVTSYMAVFLTYTENVLTSDNNLLFYRNTRAIECIDLL